MVTKPITRLEARERIIALLEKLGKPEEAERLRNPIVDYLHVEFTMGIWADEASVFLHERVGGRYEDTLVVTYQVELSWPSCTWTLAGATHALANHQAALAFAATLQALVERFPTVLYEEKETK